MDNIYNYSFYGWVGHGAPDLAVGVVIYQGTPTKVAQGVLVHADAVDRALPTQSPPMPS